MSLYDPKFDLKIDLGVTDQHLTVQYFLLYILTSIWCINIIFIDYESVLPKFDIKINHNDLYFLL